MTEAVDYESLDLVEKYADMIQIGARNTNNLWLLKCCWTRPQVDNRRSGAPPRAMLEEFLMAAEYIMSEGNYNVVLCERGAAEFVYLNTRKTLQFLASFPLCSG